MYISDIKKVIPEKNIVCISPHYDDFLFFLGGYALEMKKNGLLATKRFTNINVFSRSNYLQGDSQGNADTSLARVQFATGIRLLEDLECLDDLLGPHSYLYRVMGEEESRVRGKSFHEVKGEMEMAYGSFESMEDCDWDVLERVQTCICEAAAQEDTAIVLPLAMKSHIDHFIVREAGIRIKNEPGKSACASFYFAEDKPYAGLLNENEKKQTEDFIKQYNLKDIGFMHHPAQVLRLAYLHYPSQVEGVYQTGIEARNKQLKEYYGVTVDCDRIFTV